MDHFEDYLSSITKSEKANVVVQTPPKNRQALRQQKHAQALENGGRRIGIMNAVITLAIQCHNFQRRLCWALSSIVQQTKPGLVMVDVAHMLRNGTPDTQEVCDFFRQQGVFIKQSIWHDYERFGMRGYVRTKQLQECITPWILFSDSDMIYHPEYFEKLAEELTANHIQATYLISSGRRTTVKERAIPLVDASVNSQPVIVPDAFASANAISVRRSRAARGAGNSQIVNIQHGAHGGVYVQDQRNPDRGWSTEKGQNTKSDMRFRGRMKAGGPLFRLSDWFRERVIHLNHERDKEFDRHIETQR